MSMKKFFAVIVVIAVVYIGWGQLYRTDNPAVLSGHSTNLARAFDELSLIHI